MDKQVHKTFKSFLLSKKLWMTIFGLSVLWLAYWKQIDYLYSFTQPEQIVAFVSLTRDFMLAFTAVVLAFCGVEGVISWKHGTESVINQASSFIKEQREEKIEKIDHVYVEGQDGSPPCRPFSKIDDEEKYDY